MSYSVDTNILLHASNESSPRHAVSAAFLESRGTDPDIFCVAWITLMGYVRIATHPGIFPRPIPPAEALANVERLLRLPRLRVLSEQERFLEVYRNATDGISARANLVPDAHLAALLQQHGVRTLYTYDAGFRRFRFLDVREPG